MNRQITRALAACQKAVDIAVSAVPRFPAALRMSDGFPSLSFWGKLDFEMAVHDTENLAGGKQLCSLREHSRRRESCLGPGLRLEMSVEAARKGPGRGAPPLGRTRQTSQALLNREQLLLNTCYVVAHNHTDAPPYQGSASVDHVDGGVDVNSAFHFRRLLAHLGFR